MTKSYIESTATAFKTLYANHQSSMRHEKHANSTELAKHVWSLKRSGTDYEITWKIKARAKSYNNITKRYKLCTVEKLRILKAERQDALH